MVKQRTAGLKTAAEPNTSCGDRLPSQSAVEQDRIFLPLGYEPGRLPTPGVAPQSDDASFDLGRTMMRMSLQTILQWYPLFRLIPGVAFLQSIHD